MGGDQGSRSKTRATEWAHGLGEERHARDERAAKTAKSEEEDAARMTVLAASAGRESSRASDGSLTHTTQGRGAWSSVSKKNPTGRP
jgi:hypothetical protein